MNHEPKKIVVLGAGIIGVTSAWYLRQAGYDVTVLDRQPAAGMETSFANGGQVSVTHVEPWANPTAPLRIHIGDADDWTPAASCITLAQSLKASGQDVAITVYPGALHGFDNPITGFLRMPNVDNGSRCAFRLTSILGPLPLQYEVDECLAKGATLGGNPAALEAARQNVRAELAGLLK